MQVTPLRRTQRLIPNPNVLVAFSALTLLVGRQERHPAFKKIGGWLRWALLSLELRMEWYPAKWSVCLPLLIFPCTIKSRSSLLAPTHPGGPRKRAVTVVVWWRSMGNLLLLWWIWCLNICCLCYAVQGVGIILTVRIVCRSRDVWLGHHWLMPTSVTIRGSAVVAATCATLTWRTVSTSLRLRFCRGSRLHWRHLCTVSSEQAALDASLHSE